MDSTTWNYNKDPHQQIFVIYSLNLLTNVTTMVAGGNGGAARPTPSRDNSRLAFIQRRMFNTSLVVKDLSTGNDVVLVGGGGLSFDQQESSAPCGIYPYFSWTLDNSAILIWGSQGKFLTVNSQSGVSSVINMNVNVNLSLAPTVRTSVSLADSAQPFPVRAVNAISAYYNQTNGNSTVIYTALGSTYCNATPHTHTHPSLHHHTPLCTTTLTANQRSTTTHTTLDTPPNITVIRSTTHNHNNHSRHNTHNRSQH